MGAGSAGRRLPRRGRADPAAAGFSDLFLVRIDGVDPHPRRPVETVHCAPEIAQGNRVGLDDPIADHVCFHRRERNRRGLEPRRRPPFGDVAGLALSARPARRGRQMARRPRTAWTHPIFDEVGGGAKSEPAEPDRRCDHRVRRSMPFVYLHIVWFAAWIGFRVESYPFGLLTMIVSLEAIFLSTFVMISQNRADLKRRGACRAPVADRPVRGEAERGTPRHVEADPGSDESRSTRSRKARARHLPEQRVQGLRRSSTGGRRRADAFGSTSGGGM